MKYPDFLYYRKGKMPGERSIMLCIKNIIIESEKNTHTGDDDTIKVYMKTAYFANSDVLGRVLQQFVEFLNKNAKE